MDGAILIHEILSNHLIVLTKIGIALKKVYICGRQHIKIDRWVLDCHPPPNVGKPQFLYLLHRSGFCWTAGTLHGVIIHWY